MPFHCLKILLAAHGKVEVAWKKLLILSPLAYSSRMKMAILLLFSCLTLSTPVTFAQNAPVRPASRPAAATSFAPAAATRAWLDTVPAEKRAQSDAYFEGKYWLILWNFLVGAAVAIFFLASGLSARLRDFAERVTRWTWLQPAIYALAYVPIAFLLSFPLGVYSDYFREHAYGLATQNFGPWFREQLIGLLVAMIATALCLLMLYFIFRKAPRTWWLWSSVAGVIFLALAMLITPVFISPLFNTYKPIADKKISEPILAMASANEIPVQQVFEVDASRQSNRVSANVSGLFGTTRLSLNDNLLKQCTLPEIRLVMAHEMGHYVLNHAFKLIFYFGLFVVGGLVFSSVWFERAVRRWGERWRVMG
ncbi:MAG: M48 family metalloprotease, partial [Chthoniobacterales bacterium]